LPKINSERCESVKLCHINRSSPVFFWDTVYKPENSVRQCNGWTSKA